MARMAEGGLELGIRPMHLEVHNTTVHDGVPVTVQSMEDRGSSKIITMALNGQTIKASIPEEQPTPNGKAWLRFPAEWTRIFADGRLVG
jgi:glycerol transport system ATP-binding protein